MEVEIESNRQILVAPRQNPGRKGESCENVNLRSPLQNSRKEHTMKPCNKKVEAWDLAKSVYKFEKIRIKQRFTFPLNHG